jgi:DNA-binding transcriptional regulator/RsmH inhibitor MraZ
MPQFTDAELIAVINKAARRVNRELCLFGTDDEITIDASGCFTSTDDGTLTDLVLLQAECMVAGRNINLELQNNGAGIRVIDGEQQIDTRQRAASRMDFLNSPFGPCAEYKQQIVIEKLKRTCGYDIW